MFYDLNVPYAANDAQLPRTLAFLSELGYNVVALNHSISGKLPARISCAIPDPLPFKDVPPKLEIRRRVTLTMTDSHQNVRLAELARTYDILALRPIDERTLQQACGTLDCDVISLDLSQRLSYFFKFKTLSEAIKLGKRFEICYSQGILGDANARRNLISNATQLIRATRGRGLIISSEAKSAVGCRGPWDAINLANIWGLPQDRGFEGMSKECRSVVVTAQLKRTGYRGVVDVVYGGEKPEPGTAKEMLNGKAKVKEKQAPAMANGHKRKADDESADAGVEVIDQPISKREAKRRAKLARLSGGDVDGTATAAMESATEPEEAAIKLVNT